MVKDNLSRPPRQRVLIVSHPDGHLEVYADENITAKIVRVPVADSREAERQAEEIVEMLLPQFWRQLYWPNKVRETGTTRPLSPSTLQRSFVVRDCLQRLNALADREVVSCQ